MSADPSFTTEFLAELDRLSRLPDDRHGEWFEVVRSSWIGGVKPSWRVGQDQNASVVLSRAANNEREYGTPIVEHEVRVDLTGESLYMCPEAAISLGHHLIAAGTAAMRDLARHATWLLPATDLDSAVEVPPMARAHTPDIPEVVIEQPKVPSLAQVRASFDPRDGFASAITTLLTAATGDSKVSIDRFDWPDSDSVIEARVEVSQSGNSIDEYIDGGEPAIVWRRLTELASAALAAAQHLRSLIDRDSWK